MITVTLTPLELDVAKMVGEFRCKESYRLQLDGTSKRDPSRTHEEIGIQGASGELAFCKGMNLYWLPTVNTFKAPDIGENIEIKTTDYSNGHLLISYSSLKLEVTYVLVIRKSNVFTIVGWMQGFHINSEKYFRKEDNSFWVPQSDLNTNLNEIEYRA